MSGLPDVPPEGSVTRSGLGSVDGGPRSLVVLFGFSSCVAGRGTGAKVSIAHLAHGAQCLLARSWFEVAVGIAAFACLGLLFVAAREHGRQDPAGPVSWL